VSEILGALERRSLEGIGRLKHANGVLESFQIELEALAVGAGSE